MSGRRAIWEVARREIVERSRSRAMRVSFALLLVLAVGGAVAAARFSQGTPTDHVALVGPRSMVVAPALEAQARAAGRHIKLERLANEAAARQAVRGKQVGVALIDGRRLIVRRSRSGAAVRVVQSAVAAQATLARLRALGLSDAQALGALVQRPLPVAVLEPGARDADRNRGVVYAGILVLYMTLIGFGTAVATSVTEEKSSRVIELLLTTVSPRRLLSGKVLGVGALGFAQLVVTGGAAIAAGKLAGGAGLPSGATGTVALVVLWFVLGFAFYSVAYAAVGALVSRSEDLSSVIMPVSALAIAGFLIAMLSLEEPNGTVAKIAAFVPPLAPTVVPARVVLGDMGAFGLAAAIAVDLVATVALVRVAARIYERAILRIGAPVSLRRVLRTDTPATRARTGAMDGALRLAAVLALVGGAIIGFDSPLAIALIAVGLLLLAARERIRHNTPTPLR